MKAMILAAGLGKRMRPLTENTPKPLLQAGNRYLIDYHLEKLAEAGIKEVVINTHWLAEQIPAALGTGEHWGLSIRYSHEAELLETAGGIRQCLAYLTDPQSEVFLLINGDIYFELDLKQWLAQAPSLNQQQQVYLALVNNPAHHPEGDFGFTGNDFHLCSAQQSQKTFTYAGVGLYHASFFSGLAPGFRALGPLLKDALGKRSVAGQVADDYWLDVGSPERLGELHSRLSSGS